MSASDETIPDGPGWLLEVDPASAGTRLDRFIATRIPRLSRARAARLRVVDLSNPDIPLRKSATVRAGQRFWAHRPVPDRVPTGPGLRFFLKAMGFSFSINRLSGPYIRPQVDTYRPSPLGSK